MDGEQIGVRLGEQTGDVSAGDIAGGNVNKSTFNVYGADPAFVLETVLETIRELTKHAWEADQRADIRMTRLERMVERAQLWLIIVAAAVIALCLFLLRIV